MDIHQLQLRYDPHADRILWQVRGRGGELFRVWLTRRMMVRAGPPLQQAVARSDAATQLPPKVSVAPQAIPMLAAAGRTRPLPNADFRAPFQAPPESPQPLGEEPLLPTVVDIGPGPDGQGIRLRVRDERQRSLSLQLGAEMTTAFMKLLSQALRDADWQVPLALAEPPPGGPAEPRVLN